MMVETSQNYGRYILHGIIRYLRSHQPWSVFLELRELGAAPPPRLKDWRGDGIITRVTDPALAESLRKKRIPVVNLNDVYSGLGLPTIESDHRAIARLAAEHLLERGFRHFAACGFTGHAWSQQRVQTFRDVLGAAATSCHLYESRWGGRIAHPWEQEQERIGEWLLVLPRPVGIFACNDSRGQHVLDACQRVNLSVPEEVAVLGVDDDVLLCELCDPPLSSVMPSPERVGYEAAALLDRLMVGDSPQAEIRAVQLKRVKQLLAETDLSLDQIAELAGYAHPEYLSVVFKREIGETPGQYRRRTRIGEAKTP